jgi:hypothetical protein
VSFWYEKLGVSVTEQTALSLAASTIGFISAIFFCVGNATNSVEKIILLLTPFWDFSETIARALASQRAQYLTGGLLLLISFALQLLATVASSNISANLPQFLHAWPYLIFSIFAPVALASWVGCRAIDRLVIEKVLLRRKEIEEQELIEKNDS